MHVFPAKSMSSSRLQRIYKKNFVRKKKVKNTKMLNTRIRRRIKKCVPEV